MIADGIWRVRRPMSSAAYVQDRAVLALVNAYAGAVAGDAACSRDGDGCLVFQLAALACLGFGQRGLVDMNVELVALPTRQRRWPIRQVGLGQRGKRVRTAHASTIFGGRGLRGRRCFG